MGCEACHGGSGGRDGDEGWIRTHALETTSHAANEGRGLVSLARINALIEKLLADTRDPERFDPRRLPPELQQLQAELH